MVVVISETYWVMNESDVRRLSASDSCNIFSPVMFDKTKRLSGFVTLIDFEFNASGQAVTRKTMMKTQ